MDKNRIIALKSSFDGISNFVAEEHVEFWYARDLMGVLGYTRWENFAEAIKRAETSCLSNNVDISFHFRDVTKMVDIGMGKKRSITDVMLSRYACYLIAMNGDPRKEEIAFAQGYFAVQTRKQELIEERIQYIERTIAREKLAASETQLSKNIYERGVDDDGFARIRSKGDEALFGGIRTRDMKRKLGVKDYRPLADFLPTLTIAAKNLATEMTNYNVEQKVSKRTCRVRRRLRMSMCRTTRPCVRCWASAALCQRICRRLPTSRSLSVVSNVRTRRLRIKAWHSCRLLLGILNCASDACTKGACDECEHSNIRTFRTFEHSSECQKQLIILARRSCAASFAGCASWA